jgi:hypothetical protein
VEPYEENEFDDIHDGTFDNDLIDEYMLEDDSEIDEDWPVAPIDDDLPIEPIDGPLLAPPANFDMNMASLIEHNPDYMNNMVNAQVEFEGNWYFVLYGQIYSVPYEIEIDDDYVRQDIRNNWEGVQWRGTIYGEYIAWY